MHPAGGHGHGQDANVPCREAVAALPSSARRWIAGLVALATGAALSIPAGARAQAVPPITFGAAAGSPFAAGGDASTVVKTATRTTSAPGSNIRLLTDLAVSNPSAGAVSVLLGDGKGGFGLAPGSPFATGGSGPTGLAQSGQGYFMGSLPVFGGTYQGGLAVANAASNDVSLLVGNGSGGFGPAPGSPIAIGGSGPTALGAFASASGGEFLAVANSGSGNLSVLSGNSTNTGYSGLVPGAPFATGLSSPTALGLGDFNGDNNQDVALVDGSGASSANVAVLLGNGQGGFAPAPGSPVSSGGVKPDAIAVGDFNDDGNPDIAVANFASNTVSILLGDGHGHLSLAPGSPFQSGGIGPAGLAAWDFNGTGREDLAVTNETSGTLAMFAGDGTGRLTPEPGFPVPTGGSGPAGIVAGDFNGDELGDLAIANRQSHDVSVLLNTSTPPSFPLLAQARLHRQGTITLRQQAPTAGLLMTLVSAAHGGQQVPYGCGSAEASRAGPVSLLVTPTRRGQRLFGRTRTLRLTTRSLFLRRDEIPPLGAGGGGVRHLASRHHRPKVIVHVARARGALAHRGTDRSSQRGSGAAARIATAIGPDAQSRFGCEPPFPSL